MDTMTRHADEIADVEVPPLEWRAPGRPPLLIVRTDPATDAERALEPIEKPLPLGVRPARGDRWLDYGSGYGAFSIFAARFGAEIVVPIEPEPEVAELARRALFLEDRLARAVRTPAPRAFSTRELARTIADLRLDSLRLAGAPWLDLSELPAVGKVIEKTTRARAAVVAERLASVFENVTPPAYGIGPAWASAYVYAWGRRGAR